MSRVLPKILLADDDNNHIDLIKKAFSKEQKTSTSPSLIVVEDGQQALDYLYNQGEYCNKQTSPRPDLILLDLSMPRVNGIEVLQKIKTDEALRSIPVVVLTSSTREQDITKAYEAGANSYVTKPMDFFGFLKTVQLLKAYWLAVTKLPSW